MKTIEVDVIVKEGGTLSAEIPPDIPPGKHRALITMLDEEPTETADSSVDLPVIDIGPWPAGLSLRREDMYDDWGR